MKVLSLFDGISCGRLALERAGINVEKYVAYEIEKDAIKISKKNWADIEHRGNVETAEYAEGEFDLLIGGSPCQALSNANVYLKNGEYGVNGEGKSRLFWEYVRAFLTVKPKYFLFENVASMRKSDRAIISEQLGVEPVKINSAIFLPQIRNRLYWTNIPFEVINETRNFQTLQDLKEVGTIEAKYFLKEGTLNYILSPATKNWRSGKLELNPTFAHPLTATMTNLHRADTDNYITEDYAPEGRTNVRKLTPIECERLQGLPDNYTQGVSDRSRYKAIGNGWTVPVIEHIFRGLLNE